MTAVATAPTPTTAPASAVDTTFPAAERAAIDESARWPVLFFFGNALLWLMLATVLGLIASIELYVPEFLADVPFLSYGRIWPAYTNTMSFGWASLAGLGVTIWLLARLGRVRVKFPGVLVTGAVFWQVGLTYGIICILGGKTTGLEGLEIPTGSAILMLIGYLLVVLWAFLLFSFRSQTTPFISVWYLMAALFWFPWSFALAHAAHLLPNVPGVVQGLVAAWASQNFVNVWLTSIGLAAAYYLIPKVINRPVHSYNLAAIGFWSFILFAGLTGAVRLSGGPIPAWIVTLSIAATILLLVQIVTVTTNLVLTMRGQYYMVYHSPTIRFTFFGAISFTVASVIGLLGSLRSVDKVVHFTQFQNGEMQLMIYSFFSMVIFGAIYYILPRMVGCEWLSSSMISLHFWGAAYGGGLLVVTLLLGGLATGSALADPDSSFRYSQIMEMSSPLYGGRHPRMVDDCGGPPDLRHALPAHAPAHRPTRRRPDALCAHRRGGETLMKRSTLLLAGIVGSFAFSAFALVLVPQMQLGGMQPQFGDDEGKIVDIYPIENRGMQAGRAVYISEGCVYCHSQQVRDVQNGTDVERGWGVRRTVARDYLFEVPPLLGSSRIGPDLANVGSAKWRNEPADENPQYKPAKRDAAWELLHLYNPRTISKDSNMPSYRYLFEERKISGQRSEEALDVPTRDGYEIVPKAEARALVGYLLSLDKSHALKEVKTATPEVAAK